jgi:hypothetical protein
MDKKLDTKTSWYGTITGQQPDEQVFLRRSLGDAQVVICVGVDGYDYNRHNQRNPVKWQTSTRGKNIHIAMNAGARLSFQEFEELHNAIKTAHLYLVGLYNG